MESFEDILKKYTHETLVLDHLRLKSHLFSEVGFLDPEDRSKSTKGNINRRMDEGFADLDKKLDRILNKQESMDKDLTNLRLKVTAQTPEVTRFKAFINTVVGAVIAIFVSIMIYYLTDFYNSKKRDAMQVREPKIEIEKEASPPSNNKNQ